MQSDMSGVREEGKGAWRGREGKGAQRGREGEGWWEGDACVCHVVIEQHNDGEHDELEEVHSEGDPPASEAKGVWIQIHHVLSLVFIFAFEQ